VIFKPELVDKIVMGRKTQTRRPVKGEQRLKVGKVYAVQRRRNGPSVTRIRITDIRQELLGDITPRDAQAEGFKNTDRFFTFWEQIYEKVDRKQAVWVLTFEHIAEEREIYLGRKGGYTEAPGLSIDPEAPAVPPATVERINQRRAKGLDLGAQEELRRRAARVRAAKLRDSEVKALNRGVDISREVEAIEAYLETIRGKIGEAA
jgi:hypothetical protein